MAINGLVVALTVMTAALPAAPGDAPGVAPAGTPTTRYCLRVDPVTGSRIETIQCWTRDEWTDQGVDVDQEWAQNGVRVLA